ncbi:hypothetical protein JCM10212_003255 [Sporobolomyces blumeae]
MGLFDKKKKEKIPEVGGYDPRAVQSPAPSHAPSSSSSRPPYPSTPHQNAYSSPAPSYRTAPAYVPPSQGGSGYQNQSHFSRPPNPAASPYPGGGGGAYPQAPPLQPMPSQSKDKGGKWFGGKSKAAEFDARNELLAGAPPPGQNPHRFAPGGGGYDPYAQQGGGAGGNPYGGAGGYGGQQEQQFDNEEDEEVEGIKQQMRFTKQESLASTRNAVRIAREAEETARATLDKLGDQSDRIANTERHLDLAKAHNDRAVDETKELEALNRSIFRPTFTWNKAAKRDREERRLLDRHNAEKAEREQTRREQFESRQRIDQTYHKMDREAENSAGARARAKARGPERGRYQFEATASDDEVEDEIDSNLDELGGLAGRLKMLAMTAGQEVDSQNAKLGKITNKVDVLDNNVVKSTQRLARVK